MMHKKKILWFAIAGNVVEYYDFGIYAIFATQIGHLFFPSGDVFTQTMLAFMVFAFGFMMRPIGGIVFGHIGDLIGRKVALTTSILGMAIATLLIGILPTYEKIGILAPILLICIRLFQGICIGGEGPGSAVFILEHFNGHRAGFIGSIVMASNVIGTLVAIFIGIIISYSFADHDQSWRFGFILGGFMGGIGLYLRHFLEETPVFQEMHKKQRKIKFPVMTVIRKKWRRLIVGCCLSGIATSMAYTMRAYLNVFLSQVKGFPPTEALFFTALSLVSFVALLPIFGVLTDRLGYDKCVKFSSIGIIILIIPVFLLLASKYILSVLLGLFAMSILAASISAPAYSYLIGNFTPTLRYSGVALSWNIGNALFGGTTPTIATYLVKNYGVYAPSFYLVFTAALFLMMTQLRKNNDY